MSCKRNAIQAYRYCTRPRQVKPCLVKTWNHSPWHLIDAATAINSRRLGKAIYSCWFWSFFHREYTYLIFNADIFVVDLECLYFGVDVFHNLGPSFSRQRQTTCNAQRRNVAIDRGTMRGKGPLYRVGHAMLFVPRHNKIIKAGRRSITNTEKHPKTHMTLTFDLWTWNSRGTGSRGCRATSSYKIAAS